MQVALAVTYCFFAAGIVFGYAAIKPVLVKEGVYSQYCERNEYTETEQPCYEQEIRCVHSRGMLKRSADNRGLR